MSKTPSVQPYDVSTGARIREVRNLRGMSQEKLGEAAGISFQQVQKYEKGLNRVSASRLEQFARILGVSIHDLLPPTDTAGEELPILDDQQVKAARLMGEIPGYRRPLAIAILRQFVEG